jgi:hypothetical protein
LNRDGYKSPAEGVTLLVVKAMIKEGAQNQSNLPPHAHPIGEACVKAVLEAGHKRRKT